MEKNYSTVIIQENKNYAVEKWLQDNTDVTKKTHTPLQDVSKTRGAFGGVHLNSNTGCSVVGDSRGEGLLVYGDSMYQGHPKHSKSQQSDIETYHTASIENVLPKVFVVPKKSVKFDKLSTSDESRQLNNITSMTKVLAMSNFEDNELIRRKLQCANRYNLNPNKTELFQHTRQEEDVISNDAKYIKQKEVSTHVVDINQSVNRTSITSRQQAVQHENIPSMLFYNNPVSQQIRRHEWRHSTKRTTVRAVSSRLPPSTSAGMLDPQTPIIRGLVVDVVDNQKPSVVRASKNANIREEFALKQKVESYRNACNNNINIINHAQRKLGASLKYLRNRQKMSAMNKRCHSAPGSTTHGTDASNRTVTNLDRQRDTSSGSNNVELLVQSKGYVVETATPLKTYSFPALVYPTRRRLTIQHGE